MTAVFESSVFRKGELDDRNRDGNVASDARVAVMVPHEGDLPFTLNRYGELLSDFAPDLLGRLSLLEADNGAALAGERIAARLSAELKVPVVLLRFLVDRVLLDGNRWDLVNPTQPKNCALRPILSPEKEAEALRAVSADFEAWNRAVRSTLDQTKLSIHPHTYTPTGTDAVLQGVGSVQPYIQSHVSPQRSLRAAMSPVTFRGLQDPKSPMGVFIAKCFQLLGADRVRVGFPYGGELPKCMASDVLENGRGIVFEGNQFHIARNNGVMLQKPWDVDVDPRHVESICVDPCVEATVEWWRQAA